MKQTRIKINARPNVPAVLIVGTSDEMVMNLMLNGYLGMFPLIGDERVTFQVSEEETVYSPLAMLTIL
ncbi:MAG: hypothetical protein XU15_C0011G0100 [candidate division NC10 bacterium CSP1-5]|nr:MAG: hypothetical protein XU15_C0011G0100 [candidate division NC10 bacterium CSP1-5]